MVCFNITLHYPEYSFPNSNNNVLLTSYSPEYFNASEYNELPNQQIRLCLNYKPSFLKCTKWKLYPDEYYVDEVRNLIYKAANEVYPLRQYIRAEDNSSYVCIPEYLKPVYNLEWIFIFCWTLSIITLTIALTVNAPCKRITKRKFDFKPLTCHMIAFIITNIVNIFYQLTYSKFGEVWRIIVVFAGAYTDCSTFSWLSVVGYDTWRAFHPTKLLQSSEYSAKGFAFRCLYAWGLPAIVVCLALILEHFRTSQRNFGMSIQGLDANIANNVLIYGSQALVLVIQFIFCVLTVINIKRELNSASSALAVKQKRKTFVIFIKLVVVMSVTSLLAVMGFFLYFVTKSPLAFFLPTGIALQGVFLFLIHGLGPLKKKCQQRSDHTFNITNNMSVSSSHYVVYSSNYNTSNSSEKSQA